jgi:hypothetical protein
MNIAGIRISINLFEFGECIMVLVLEGEGFLGELYITLIFAD